MPMMPFIGVRISWLMLARNSLLARLAASAASLARRSSSSARLRSVMSRMMPMTRPFPPALFGLSVMSTGNSLPSFRRPYNSRPEPIGRDRGLAE